MQLQGSATGVQAAADSRDDALAVHRQRQLERVARCLSEVHEIVQAIEEGLRAPLPPPVITRIILIHAGRNGLSEGEVHSGVFELCNQYAFLARLAGVCLVLPMD